jgi:hypothetical protein
MSYSCPICDSSAKSITAQILHHECTSEDVALCSKCHHLFLSQHFDDSSLVRYNRNFYRNSYTKRSFLTSFLNSAQRLNRQALLRGKFHLPTDQSSASLKLLEIGPGINPFLHNSQIASNNITYDVIETDLHARNAALSYANRVIDNVNFLEPEYYDVIVAFHVLEHIPDPLTFLSKLYNCLSRNGLLVVEIPYLDYLRPSMKSFFPHLHSFSESSLNVMLSRVVRESDSFSVLKYGYTRSATYHLYRFLEAAVRHLPSSVYAFIVELCSSPALAHLGPYSVSSESSPIWLTAVISKL